MQNQQKKRKKKKEKNIKTQSFKVKNFQFIIHYISNKKNTHFTVYKGSAF